MNKRFLSIQYDQSDNIDIDRKHFNINSRNDKTLVRHKINTNNNIKSTLFNVDRQFFNLHTANIKMNNSTNNNNYYMHQLHNNTKITDNRIETQNYHSKRKTIKSEPFKREVFINKKIQPIITERIPIINTQNDYRKIEKFDPNKTY